MSETAITYDGEDVKAKQTSVSLYDRDKQEVERVREHYRLDTFSQALRRCIRETVDLIDAKEQAA